MNASLWRCFVDDLYGFLYRYLTAIIKSIRLFILSGGFWTFPAWIGFWLSRTEELKVLIQSTHFYVRSRRIHLKLTDLYMITSCVVLEQYNCHENFRISESDVIIDIGAHIGSFSVYAAQKALLGHIFSYEPDVASYQQLLKNVQANNLRNVSVFQEAVGGQAGMRTLYSAALNSAENNFYWNSSRASVVECTTLTDIFKKNKIRRCDFLKIDCEGAEYEIILNTPADILKQIKRICVECHVGYYFGMRRDDSTEPPILIDFLRRSGFTLKVWRENALHTFIWAIQQ
ncbi:MAG: hypothetical protein A3G41_02190 [Elusimicrobia bacterium RIFCSPLOWO2_12_FULL_59_9]|nr:MAG: hypothetical protein A3G41_02190 [Elusimicrobia bacterium RIFCSPLOWO2_12_FULL_59_9]